MTFAMVKVFPEPVTPKRVTAGTPFVREEQMPSMAEGWSPAGLYEDCKWNFIRIDFNQY